MTKSSSLRLYSRLLNEARPYWPLIGGLLILHLLGAPLRLLMPIPLKLVVDNVLGTQPVSDVLRAILPGNIVESPSGMLVFAVILLVVVTGLIYLQALALWVVQTYAGQKLVLAFRAKLFRHVQELSFSFHDTRGSTVAAGAIGAVLAWRAIAEFRTAGAGARNMLETLAVS